MTTDTAHTDALQLVERLNALLDALSLRGLRAVGSDERARLCSHRDALHEIGAEHLSQGLSVLLQQLDAGRREAAISLLKVRASVRVFERLLSLRLVAAELRSSLAVGEGAL